MKKAVNKVLLKELKNKKGVYAFSFNNHLYIGSSKNLYSRYKEHLASLRRGNHYNIFLQRCFNKYGMTSLEYKVLEICEDYIDRETYYIKMLKPSINVEQDPLLKNKSEETKLKIGLANKGKLAGDKNPASKKVHQYDLNGMYIKTYNTMQEASLDVGLSKMTINSNSIKRTKRMGGYMWCLRKVKKLKPLVPDKGHVKYKYVVQKDLTTGKTKRWKSMTELAKSLGISVQAVYKAIKNNKQCKNYILQIQLN
jgi:group I intron endonuclease